MRNRLTGAAGLILNLAGCATSNANTRAEKRRAIRFSGIYGNMSMTGLSASSWFRVCLLLAGLVWLQGCATLNKDECLAADWRLIGYQDGAAGKSTGVLGGYREDCAEYAVVPDLDRYQAGRAEGLLEFCKADNGYRLGETGRGFPAVCPAQLEGDFRAAYQRGKEIYRARSAVRETHALLHERKRALYYLEEDKGDKLSELLADDLKSEQRLLILYEISELEQQRYSVENDITTLEQDLAEQQAHLEYLTQHNTN